MTTPVPITSRTGMFRGNSVDQQSVIDLQGLITQAATQVTSCATNATAAAASAASAATQVTNVNAAATSGVANINAAVTSGNATVAAAAAGVNSSVTVAVSASTSASGSATSATASATAAASSASAASTSATAASGSATAASTSATNASTSATNAANSATSAQNAAALLASSSNVPYTSTPTMNGTGSAGTSGNYSRGDHVHPTDTSRAPLASPTFTGSATMVNLNVTTTLTLNGVAVATTAAIPTAYASTPAMNGTASAGSSSSWAKGDHVHPVDTSRAPLASPVFTGLVGYNANAAAIPAGPAGFTANTVTVNGADNSGSGVVVNGFGTASPTFYGRNAGGTGATPAATVVNQSLLQLAAGGYGTTWGAVQGSITIKASATWTGTSQPTYITFNNTPTGTTTLSERMRITAPGNVLIGTTTDDGVNQLQVAGAAKVTGAATFASTVALAADPTTALQASTKQYVDNTITSRSTQSFRNVLINSTFRVNQRNGGTVTTTGGFPVDRWQHFDDGTGSRSLIQYLMSDTDRTAIGDEEARSGVQIVTNGGAGTGAFDTLTQRIEGVRTYAGKTVTLSFWAVATAGSSIAVELLQNFGTGGFPSALVTGIGATKIALTTSWARYTVTMAVPSLVGKTPGSNGDDYLALNLYTSAGTSFASRTGSLPVQTSVTTTLWGVQLEVGSVATPLEKVANAVEVANCQRFYAAGVFNLGGSAAASGAGVYYEQALPVSMRAVPTIVISSVTALNCASAQGLNPNPNGFTPYAITSAAGAYTLGGAYTATAEL